MTNVLKQTRSGRKFSRLLVMGILASASMVFAGSARGDAETVSVWKLEQDIYGGGKSDAHSLVDQAYDLTPYGTRARTDAPFTGTPATLPGDLDHLEDTDNLSALRINDGMLKNTAIIPYLELTNSWTVEGWYAWKDNPVSGGWIYVFGTRNSADGWFVTRRNHSGVFQFELYSEGVTGGGAIKDGTVLWPDVPEELTNTWKHIALTYDADGTDTHGKGVWKFYVDGELITTVTNRGAVTSGINRGAFYIGGRDNNNLRSSFFADYWRVSRGVLTPEQFLNASGVKPTVTSDTLAYYRLDQNGDFKNAAGTAYRLSADQPNGTSLSDAYNYITGLNLAPSTLQAFDRCPNASVDLVNSGSVRLYGQGSRLVHTSLGSQLEPDKPFTIEGWVYRIGALSDANHRSWTMMFGTRDSGTGFALWYGMWGNNSFGLYCNTTGGVVRADTTFPRATNIPFENKWKHVALTQTPNGFEDKTVWELFLDGESMGCVTGTIASANQANRPWFFIGSRPNSMLGAGYYDCFRVCSRVLSPDEFLNAAEGGRAVAQADVLAFWPLDTINNGLYLDLHDLRGNYDFGKLSDFTGCVTTNAEQAVDAVPNPDASVLFGDPAGNNGSVSFPDSGKTNYLCVNDGINGKLGFDKDFTIESWIRLKKLPSNWWILYNAGVDNKRWGFWIRSNGGVVKYMMIAHSGSTYYIDDNTFFAKDGVTATVTSADVNVWRHIALVYRANGGPNGRGAFEMFVDGVSKGVVELKTTVPVGFVLPDPFLVGGRPGRVNSIVGDVDHLRISSVALTPDKFLCADAGAAPSPVAPKTLACWPLEYDGTAADESDRATGRFPFAHSGSAPVGTNTQYRTRVANPDRTAGFIGDPSVNVGSVLNTSSCVLGAPGLRGAVNVFSAFTAEGWIRWSGQGTLPQAIVGNSLEKVRGWSLSVTGERELRLIVHEANGWELVNRRFATGADSLANEWRHVAVTYSRWAGTFGRWEVFLDGKSLGTVENACAPSATDGLNGRFGIGAQSDHTPFAGLLDYWRVSDGVLAPDDFLYVNIPNGTLILFK